MNFPMFDVARKVRYNAEMKTTKALNPLLSQELLELGAYLRELRLKRQLTLLEMSERLGANPRTVSKIEKGDSTVSLGTFINYLNILGLARGLAERILGDYLLVVAERKKKRVFTDDEMNF